MTNEPTWPSDELYTVTPSDATVFARPVRQLFVGTGGNVSVLTQGGQTILFKNVGAGSTIGPFFISKVLATNTTATDIVAFT